MLCSRQHAAWLLAAYLQILVQLPRPLPQLLCDCVELNLYAPQPTFELCWFGPQQQSRISQSLAAVAAYLIELKLELVRLTPEDGLGLDQLLILLSQDDIFM